MKSAREGLLSILTCALMCAALALFFADPAAAAEAAAHGGHDIGTELPVWTALPFAGILLSIALCPLLMPHFWHNHFGKISIFWSVLFAVPFLFFYHQVAVYHILHIYLIDYIPFIILLWGLFTIAGGIVVRGSLKGTPALNTVMLLIGTILASCVGTTGAAMVMIRPVLRANKDRLKKTHVVCFFIFLVANIGGSLTPLGDPPLFLGFLHNVPFFWVTTNLLPHMLTASAILLVMFFIVDTFFYRKEKVHVESGPEEEKIPFKIEGVVNFVFLLGVIGLVLMSGYWKPGHFNVLGVHLEYQGVLRDLGIITMGALSLVFTSKILREANDFSWFPIMEVAKLFAGIFMTIIPALAILKAGNDGALSGLVSAVQESYHYFWVTGALSSFLDNAPTYLTFFNLALGKLGIAESAVPAALAVKAATTNPEFIMYLKAISAGAVFMGANTYIGNAPNFMVKSIAEEAGINMPSFFGYMIKYSIPILVPVFILVTLIFF
ncbi:MAG: sodium:proton antiporter [Syntrophales bacterium]|nr:sodium:proton antiporter [Syntrophales bacterium]